MRRSFFDAPSPILWMAFAAFATVLFLINQVVTVVPYPNRERDKLLWDLASGGSALLAVALAHLAHRRRARLRKSRPNDHRAPNDQ